jgi:hypothetical protein
MPVTAHPHFLMEADFFVIAAKIFSTPKPVLPEA